MRPALFRHRRADRFFHALIWPMHPEGAKSVDALEAAAARFTTHYGGDSLAWRDHGGTWATQWQDGLRWEIHNVAELTPNHADCQMWAHIVAPCTCGIAAARQRVEAA